MHTILKRTRTMLGRSLGRCPRCMRQSFLAAVAAWALVVVLGAVDGTDVATALAALTAAGLTALWA